jgi:hypothetical protein
VSDRDRLIPNGFCWCGCEKEVGLGKFFAQGHDKISEAALMAAEYEASVARLLAQHKYGPQRSVTQAAVDSGRWERCDICGYPGAPESIRNHKRKYHQGG